ncbi:ATP-binding protein [Pseudomonas oryzihabitans]|uniref:ATP-binding protein n=1 Tax=Pseudomonas oryzihabitans TaxID=47885 RepID=UPI0028AD3BAD|nr:ATP-binding protein [Pseudomonas oryzihabitans]
MATSRLFSRQPAVDTGDHLAAICPEHGRYIAALVEQFDGTMQARGCNACRWAALNLQGATEEMRLAASESRQQEVLNELLIASGIPPRFIGSTFDSFVATEPKAAKVLAACRGYADDFPRVWDAGRCLILLGGVGTGKSHLACAIAQAVIRQHGAQALVVTAAAIVRQAKATMAKGAQHTEADVIAELVAASLLIIDEVGAQRGSEYELGLMHEVIAGRYDRMLPTVVVSNLADDGLAEYIGTRAVDRLRQNGGKRLTFDWASVRRDGV